jgi:peptide/nickel transport system substrate-binding protein
MDNTADPSTRTALTSGQHRACRFNALFSLGMTKHLEYSAAIALATIFISVMMLASCARRPAADELVMIIESSPASLDPRVGTDAPSERISQLMFDSLVRRDKHFELQPSLAERWETPDPLTCIFHLRYGVRFHDGRTLTSRDVKWTFDSIIEGKIKTPKASAYRYVDRIDTPDDATIVFHLKEPYATLLSSLSAVGIVPDGAGSDIAQHPIGTGPFRFVSMQQDKDVVIRRNDDYWHAKPKLARVRFTVVPDTTTRALELRKGTADVAENSLTADMIGPLSGEPNLEVEIKPGTTYSYIAMNLRDPILSDVRVRKALAYAIHREPMIRYLWRDQVQAANSILPPQQWAYDPNVRAYDYDPERARELLDEAGYPVRDGARFHLTMKTSTEESTRLMAAVLQQQLADVGIALDIRTFEFATFYADVAKGAFQLFSMRWVGGNEDPDIFEHVFHSTSIPPKRANRGYYSNPAVDELIDAGRRETDREKRKRIYWQLQEILAEELPYISLWYSDNVLVHNKRVRGIEMTPSGNYDFLTTAELADR